MAKPKAGFEITRGGTTLRICPDHGMMLPDSGFCEFCRKYYDVGGR